MSDHPEATPAARSRRLPRLLGTVALVVGVGVVSSLTTVWATHDFPDVPNSSPHHADISWAVDNDITQGYNDGTFRPTQAVSRQTMATFLRRLNAEYVVVQSATSTSTSPSSTSYAASTSCGAGRRALAGGGSASGTGLFMRASYPSADQWFVDWETEDNAAIGTRTLTVWALCAPGL